MAGELTVYKNRTNIIPVSLGYDVSSDTLTSEIREEKISTSTLIATWVVSYATDGIDGEILLTLDDSALTAITQKVGYMDIKRVSGGEPLPVFSEPIKVVFKDVVTA